MSRALDVKERTRSVNDKITYAAEVLISPFPFLLLLTFLQAQSVLRQLLTEVCLHATRHVHSH